MKLKTTYLYVDDSGLWTGKINQKVGIFPGSYVEKIELIQSVKDEPDFDGSNTDKRNWILREREKLAGWKTEYDKTLDNSAAAGLNDGLPRPVRLRCYNMKDVIVEQVFYCQAPDPGPGPCLVLTWSNHGLLPYLVKTGPGVDTIIQQTTAISKKGW